MKWQKFGDHFFAATNMSSMHLAITLEFIVMRVIPLLVIVKQLKILQDPLLKRPRHQPPSLPRKKELCGDTLANFNEDSQQIKFLDAMNTQFALGKTMNKKHVGSNPGLNVRDFYGFLLLLLHFRHAESDGIPKVSPWSTGQCQTGRFR